jgi:hypothetical protein
MAPGFTESSTETALFGSAIYPSTSSYGPAQNKSPCNVLFGGLCKCAPFLKMFSNYHLKFIFYFYSIYLFAVLGLEFRAYTSIHSTSPFL